MPPYDELPSRHALPAVVHTGLRCGRLPAEVIFTIMQQRHSPALFGVCLIFLHKLDEFGIAAQSRHVYLAVVVVQPVVLVAVALFHRL